MKKKLSKKAKIITASVSAFVILLGSIAYAAADRYLIEHVKSAVNESSLQNIVSSLIESASSDSIKSSSDSNTSSGTESTSAVTSTSSSSITSISSSSSSSSSGTVLTDTTFDNGVVNITITKKNASDLVYYVADVTVKSGAQILSAFAKNSYGTNITQKVSAIASAHNAIFAINGDYYGFRSDGIIIRNGVIYRNVPSREGLAIYKDGTMKVYDETATSASALLAEGVWNTLSFGPALLENGKIISGIDSVEVDTNFGNHSIQGNQPRTGIGIISQNHFVFVVADGRSSTSGGVTMTEFAQIFKNLGCTTAYNMDGGGSSEMWFNGSVVNNPSNGGERATSDILYISR